MMYVSQVIMLYTLNLHSAVSLLYLNKTDKKKSHLEKLFSGIGYNADFMC